MSQSQPSTPERRHLGAGQFYGRTQARRSLPGLILSELLHEQGRSLPQHTHEHAYFCLLLDGAYE